MTDLNPLIARLAAIGVKVAATEAPTTLDSLKAALAKVRATKSQFVIAMDAAGTGLIPPEALGPVTLIDLTGMDQIVELSGPFAYALVEPGVTFRQLGARIATEKLPLWVDATIDPDVSVAASALARQFGYTPHGDRLMMQCGAEVILPGGDVVRLGMGAVPGSKSWQMFKHNFGAYLDGLFSQSDMGVVTKLGVWLSPQPPEYRPFRVLLDDAEAADKAINALRPLRIANVIALNVAITTPLFDEAMFGAPKGGSRLSLTSALIGLPKVVALTWPLVEKTVTDIAGAKLIADNGDPYWGARKQLMQGSLLSNASLTAPSLTFAAPAVGDVISGAQDIFKELAVEYLLTGRSMMAHVINPKDAGALIAAAAKLGFGLAGQSLEFEQHARAIRAKSGLATTQSRLRAALHA